MNLNWMRNLIDCADNTYFSTFLFFFPKEIVTLGCKHNMNEKHF